MRVVGLLLLCASSSACLFDPGQPSGIVVRCDDDRDCRSPQVCDDGVCGAPDVVAPGQIVDLAVELAATTDVSLTLVFTAPGDDGNGAGDGPRRYRVTATPLLAGGVARTVDVEATAAAREREKIVVDGLLRGTVYSVVVEATDDAGLSTTSAPLLAETGGALCVPDAATGALTARGDTLTITRPEHLVRLYGCEVIEGSLKIVDEDCEITQLAALRNLRTVTIGLEISGNELCGRGLVDLSDLAALESVEQFSVQNTGTLVDVSLDAAINSVTITANRALARVSLPRRASAGGTGIDVQGNPSLTTLVAGVRENVVRVFGNEALQTVTLDAFETGDVLFDTLPALTGVSLSSWATGSLYFVDNPKVASLTLPVLASAGGVQLAGIDDLTAFAAPSLVDVTNLDFVFVPRLATLVVGAESAGSLTLRQTALTTVPPLETSFVTLIDNPALADLSGLRLSPVDASVGVSVTAHDNPSLPPCAVLALAATAGLDAAQLDLDLPAAPCPVDTPLPTCGRFAGGLEVDGDEQLATLFGCGRIEFDLILRHVTSTAALEHITAVGGTLRIEQSPSLSSVALNVASVGAFEVDDVAALSAIALPALQSFHRFRIARAPALTGLLLGDLSSLDGTFAVVELRDTALANADAFEGLTALASLRLANTGIDDLAAAFSSLRTLGSVDVDDDDVDACDVFAFAARVDVQGQDVTVPLVDADANGVVDVDETICDPDAPMPACGVLASGHTAACGSFADDLLIGSFLFGPEVRLPNLRELSGTLDVQTTSVTTIELPALVRANNVTIKDNLQLTTVRLPSLTTVTSEVRINDNPALRTLDLSSLRTAAGICDIEGNPLICSSVLSDIYRHATCDFEIQFGADLSC